MRELYDGVGWSAYTASPESLERAVRNSTFVVSARAADTLVGLARVLSDDVSILYIQDVLVHPSHQRQGIGRDLLGHTVATIPDITRKARLPGQRLEKHTINR